TLFGRSDRVTACACERSGDVTLPQLLNLANGQEVHVKIRAPDGRLAMLLKTNGANDRLLIEDVFLATVCRKPSEKDIGAVTMALNGANPKERDDVFRDLFWALVNSKEFAFNH
ncbi:MAG: hypothetical protein ACAI43_08520, partial [Phycisphaerae bacterium]